jgi:hypothetical protein
MSRRPIMSPAARKRARTIALKKQLAAVSEYVEEKTRQALAELDGPAASTTPGGQVLSAGAPRPQI